MCNIIKSKLLLFAIIPMSSLFGIVGSLDLFHQNDVVSMYFQPESIKGRGIKSVIVVLDFENTQTNQDGKEVRSIRMVQNYDCAWKKNQARECYKLRRQHVARQRGFEGKPNNILAENTKRYTL